MKKEETKIEETMETVDVNSVEEIQEEKEPGLVSKAVGFFKKHGKKIVAGAGMIIGGAILYALGSKSGSSSVDSTDDIDYRDLEVIDCNDYSVDEAE